MQFIFNLTTHVKKIEDAFSSNYRTKNAVP